MRRQWAASHPIVTTVAKRVFDMEVAGSEHIPDGPCVVGINHLSHADVLFAGAAFRRPIRFLATGDIVGESWVLDAALKFYGAIPVPRDRTPVGAVRAALRHLEDGGRVGIFPEGRRTEGWGSTPLKRGAAWLATHVGVPLVPIALTGTNNVMGLDSFRVRKASVSVSIGEPLYPDGDDQLLIKRWAVAMNDLGLGNQSPLRGEADG